MDLNIATHQARTYTVSTPVYNGPLDLLLQLIERAELDITRLALAQVTDQYLVHIRQMEEKEAEEVSAFLVIAARLIQIKSEALLPRPPVREEGEEDPGEALARQLMIYKKYKKIADVLSLREASGLRTHLRLAPPPRIEGTLDLTGIGIGQLVEAARGILLRLDLRPELKTVVSAPLVTIRQKIGLIFTILHERGRLSFRALLHGARSRLEVVVTFLAMLELVKRHRVTATQTAVFGDIELEASPDWLDGEVFDLEFGE